MILYGVKAKTTVSHPEGSIGTALLQAQVKVVFAREPRLPKLGQIECFEEI